MGLIRIRIRKLVVGLILGTGLVGLGAAALRNLDYSPFDRRSYLSREQIAFVRPGLQVEMQGVNVAADRTVSVVFKITDDRGLPLDREGIFTPGPISISFVLAHMPRDQAQYKAYTTRIQTSPITGESAVQPTADSGGTFSKLEDGVYRYTFGTRLPEGYDPQATHSIGFYSRRDLSEFELGNYDADGVVHFIPGGGEVLKVRDVVATEACNSCHDPLTAHGQRHSVELCVTCHYDGVVDPDTGESVDFAVMIHKIHRGEQLPSVEAGKPYQIIGFQQSVHDYSNVVFPQDIRNCDTCHSEQASQSVAYLLRPSRASCGSCHDDVNFATGENHAGGAVLSDIFCSSCHLPEGELEFDASIKGAHIIPTQSAQLRGINIEILDVTNTGPGLAPSVLFSVKDDAGSTIPLGDLASLNFLLAGPTDDYEFVQVESALNSAVPMGDVYAYQFNAAIPEEATGSFSVGAEGYRNVLLNAGTTKEMSVREATENPVYYFSVTDTESVSRRVVVSDEKCEACHQNLSLHGGQRHNATEYCQICHNPLANDSPYRPEDLLPARSIDFKLMIHRIHMGEELTRDYTLFGFRGSVNNFNEVRYPGDLRNCEACHLEGTYNAPAGGVLDTITPNEFFSPMSPTSTACLGCHDTKDAAAHAFLGIAPFGESCATCHGEAREFSVARVHSR